MRLHDKKLTELEEIVEKNPDDSKAWLNLGVMLGQAAQLDSCIKAFRKAIELDSENARAYIRRC